MPLKDYIQGKKHGKEANRLEREAMNDPFLQEALDGLENVAGDHAKIIDRLEKRFSNSTTASQKNKNVFLYWSIAASVLLLIGWGAYFLSNENKQSTLMLAENQVERNESVIAADSFAVQPEPDYKKEAPQEPLITAEVNKKVRPTPIKSSVSPETELSEKLTYMDSEKQTIQGKVVDEAVDSSVILKDNNLALNEVVVIGYGTQKKEALTGAVARVKESDSIRSPFGEKEFQAYCQQKANKNVCNGKDATVKISFFIDEAGKPTEIEYKKYSCESAKQEIENLLSLSPAWTETNRRVTMTVKW